MEFTLEPTETFICEITIHPRTYEDINETFMYDKYTLTSKINGLRKFCR